LRRALEVVPLVVLYRRVSVPRDWIFFEQDRFEPRAIANLQFANCGERLSG